MSSLVGTPTSPQFIAHRIGVEKRRGGAYWAFPESAPARRIWSGAELTENLGAMAERRVMEALRKVASRPPFAATIRVALGDMHAWLSGEVDEARMRVWLDRLCVFDWGDDASGEAATELQHSFTGARPTVDGALALYALFRPLASDWLFRRILGESGIQTEGGSTCASFGCVVAMLRHGDVNAAAEAALAAYRSAGVALADFSVLPAAPDPARLLATLVIPVRDEQVLAVFRRWRSPAESKEE